MESVKLPQLFLDDRKVFTAKANIANNANFWLHDEFSATIMDSVASGKWKLVIKNPLKF